MARSIHFHTPRLGKQQQVLNKKSISQFTTKCFPQKAIYVNGSYQELKYQESQAFLSEESSQIFAQRRVDVESVFGQIKACLGYKRCNLLKYNKKLTNKKEKLTLNMTLSFLLAENSAYLRLIFCLRFLNIQLRTFFLGS